MSYKSFKRVHGQKAHDQWGIFGNTQQGVPPAYVVPYQVPQAWPRYGIQDSAFYGFGSSLGCGPECSCAPCRAATAALQGLGGCGCSSMRPVVGGSSAEEFQGLGVSDTQSLVGGVLSGLVLAGVLAGVVVLVAKAT